MNDYDIRLIFQRSALRHGERTALANATASWTYRELDTASDHLALKLAEAGIGRGSVVGILTESSAEVVISVLGVLKAGCAFMPLDPRAPDRRLLAMTEVAQPAALLVGEGQGVRVQAGTTRVLALADGHGETAGSRVPLPEMGPDDLCYVYFTSGSTGSPKGISGRLKSIAHFIRWEIETLGVEAGWRVSQLTSPSFDAFLRDIFVPLAAGGEIQVPADDVVGDAVRLRDWLAQQEINLLHCVPSLLRTLMAIDPPRPLPALRWALLSGEPLLPSDVKAWYARQGETTRLMNLYGPSETTMTKFFYLVGPADGERRTVPIGKPMPGSRAVILDARQRVCPPRGIGEIYIRTPFRSLGYLGRPDLTEDVFVPNPFGKDPGDLIYRTGDLGRVLEDGNFEFLGRRDHQVKIRGVRIELQEIENRLLEHEAVSEAAVVDWDDGSGTKYLAAYVISKPGTSMAALRGHLSAYLPEHSLPSAFVRLETLPRTLTGKIDRRQLPAPDQVKTAASDLDLPRSPVEEILAALFARILGRERVGIHENFFQIGGHSLLATQLLVHLRTALGIEITLRELFETPTVAGLERTIAKSQRGGALRVPALEPAPRGEPYPLSFAQERLWFLHRLEPLKATYNIPLAMRLRGRFDVLAFRRALQRIAERHEVLRTVFKLRDGRPVPVVLPGAGISFQVVDLARLPEARREATAQVLAFAEAGRPFDLECGPLVCFTLFRLGAEDHFAVLSQHHITSDGWSLGVFLRECSALYRAAVEGSEAVLPELEVQYGDFAAWQRSWLTDEVLMPLISYWKDYLDGSAADPELPTDRPRPAVPSYRGIRLIGGALPARLSEGLSHLASSGNATLFMVLLAGFEILLHRYTGNRRFSIGTPIANRSRSEIERLIGFFVNTLVLAPELSGEEDLETLLTRVKEDALRAYTYQDLPFERLVEALQPERHLAHSPLFRVMFVLQNMPLEPFELPGLTLTPMPLDTGSAKFDLTLVSAPRGGTLDLALECAADLFDRTTGQRMLGHYRNLLKRMVETPRQRISDLPLLAGAERHQLMVDWNDTQARAWDLPVHQLFTAQAARTPDAVALLCEETTLSYGELDAWTNRLAHLLRRIATPGTAEMRMGLAIERSAEMIVALLAILKAGAAFVPLDPSTPEARLAFLTDDAELAAVVTEEGLADRFPSTLKRVMVDRERPAIARQSAEDPGCLVHRENPAYVIYTSGSTGRPKGVVVEYRQIVNYLSAVLEPMAVAVPFRAVLVATIAADAGLQVIFGTLLTGGSLEVVTSERLLRPDGLAEGFARRPADVMKLVPSLLASQLKTARARDVLPRRLLVIGGEASGWDLVGRIRELDPDCRILHHYGPTEATVGVTTWTVAEKPAAGRGWLPIGRPLGNCRVFVADRRLRLSPAGVAGELYLAGANLARGYLRRPGLSAQRFVPDPFSPQDGCRLYRTGDLVRALADGRTEFLGRLDHQIKLRGFRIELGEIEGTLAEHPGIAEAAVRIDGERLIAYALAVPGFQRPSGVALNDWLGERLPRYMFPSSVVFLDELPLTGSGKVDRAALGRLPPSDALTPGGESAGGAVLAEGPIEQLLAGIWEELLGVSPVGPQDDFFGLGGHSLLATRLLSRVVEVFGVEIPLRDVFVAPTLRQFACRLEAKRAAGAMPGSRPEPVRRDGPMPLSFSQQRLWFLEHLEPGNVAYNMPFALDLEGGLDVMALARAVAEVERRHEVLRTRLTTIDGRPWQMIAAPGPPHLALVDYSSLDELARSRQRHHRIVAEATRPFRLEEDAWLRVSLLRWGARDHTLLVTMHHIGSDGRSMEILIDEIAVCYRTFTSSAAPSPALRPPLPELTVQYADYAIWQRSFVSDSVLEAELAYWRRRLAAAPALVELPGDRARPAVRTWTAGRARRCLPGALSRELAALGRHCGATPFMVVLAGFATLLRRSGSQALIPIGTPTDGRNRQQLEGLIGFFVNTLIIPADLTGDPSFGALLGRVRESFLDSFAHQAVPFEKLVQELEPRRSLSHSPLFQVMVAWQQVARRLPEIEGLRLVPAGAASGRAKFDLTLLVQERDAGQEHQLEYSRELFDEPTVLRLLGQLERLLSGACSRPAQAVAELPLLSLAESHQVLRGWNDTRRPGQRPPSVMSRFLAQAERSPEAAALLSRGTRTTFRQLRDRALALAACLRERGVGPDVVVGLCIERSTELVAAVLGILAAGGAYLPLDPTYPEERVRYLLDDSGARLVLAGRGIDPPARHGIERMWLDEPHAAEPLAEPVVSPHPESLAYVIYTSGSTGRPKGTPVSHRALAHYLAWSTDAYVDGAARGAPLASPLGFDLTVTSLFTPLSVGHPVTLVPEEDGPEGLTAVLARNSFGFVKLTPAHLGLLEHGLTPAEARRAAVLVILGGAAVRAASLASWRAHAPGLRVINEYGPTEATVGCSVYELRGDRGLVGDLPIGRPIPGARLYVLDRRLQPAPVGVAGEICIAGPGLARGYLGRPALTGERFLPEAWNGPGSRLYRSGDLARFLADGNLCFLGRLDRQLKVHGFRIEPGEIEAALIRIPAVAAAAVTVLETGGDSAGDRRLIAHVVPRPGASVAPAALRRELEAWLPPHMLPSAFVAIERLPLTSHGKVDYGALPAPDRQRPDLATSYQVPRSVIEEQLAAIWAEVLGLAKVGVHDNFFHLGGDSILSIRIVSRANRAGLNVTVRQIFEHQTVASLAAVAGSVRPVEAEQGPVVGEVPQTPVAKWFFEQRLADRHHYNQALLLAVSDGVDARALKTALAALVRHHDALRLRCELDGGSWRQWIAAPTAVPEVHLVDLDGLPAVRLSRAVTACAAAVQTTLDLARSPLLRAVVFRRGPGRPDRLLLVIHHLAVDGVSWRVLMEDLEVAYGALAEDRLPALPPKTTSFKRWSERLVEHAGSEEVLRELPYWSAQGRRDVTGLPIDSHGGNTVAHVETLTVSLTESDTGLLLRQVPCAYRTEINDVLLTAVVRAFASWTGSPRLLIDLEGHGREEILSGIDVSRTVGWFTTIFPVLLSVEGAVDLGASLMTIKEQLREVPSRGIGFGLLRYLAGEQPAAELASRPLAEVSFNYMGQLDPEAGGARPFALAPEEVGALRSPRQERRHLLEINGRIFGGRLLVSFHFNRERHRRSTVERLAAGFLSQLRALIEHCTAEEAGGVTPSDFPLARLTQDSLLRAIGQVGQAKV